MLFKLFILFYADDTVICSETANNFQTNIIPRTTQKSRI